MFLSKYFIIILYFGAILQSATCSCQVPTLADKKIVVAKNYNVTAVGDTLKYNAFIQYWEDYLNCGKGGYYTEACLAFWSHDEEFPFPNYPLQDIGDYDYLLRLKTLVIAVYPVAKDVYALKTMFYYQRTPDRIELNAMYTVYVTEEAGKPRLLSSPQWYMRQWQKQTIHEITYFYPPSHKFDQSKALEFSKLNTELSQIFKTNPIAFRYFLCKDIREVYEVKGYQFELSQYVPNPSGGICDSYNHCLFAGNGTESYPHEAVHLYITKFEQENNVTCHQWFNEGTATLFGGSREHSLEWHMKKLKTYLEQHPTTDLSDITKLPPTLPNGDHTTEYIYVIGGMICKKVYETKGIEGLADLWKSGEKDVDFYRAIAKHLNIRENDLGSFIRNELEKI